MCLPLELVEDKKINNRISLNAEYFYVLPNQIDPAF
jgi:hypothetical protein